MENTIRLKPIELTDLDLDAVFGGADPCSETQYSEIYGSVQGVILKILAATQPSYGYSDAGANFMALIYDWGEFVLQVNGKRETDPKCIAIEAVLNAKGFDTDRIRSLLLAAAPRYA